MLFFRAHVSYLTMNTVMLGTADQMGQRLIHFTLSSVQITLPEHTPEYVCLAQPLQSKIEQQTDGKSRGMENTARYNTHI